MSNTTGVSLSQGMPNIGAIIPTVRGRKIAYAIFAVCWIVIGDLTVYAAIAWESVPTWLIAAGAVVSNTAPIFAGIAIANAKDPELIVEA